MTEQQKLSQELQKTTTPSDQPQRRELVKVHDDSMFANFLDSDKFSQLQRVAWVFAKSSMVPEHFRGEQNLGNTMIAIEMAMRLGVSPFMMIQNSYIVHGRPGIEAKLAIALVNSSGKFTDSLDYEISGEDHDDPKNQTYKVRAFATRRDTGKVVKGPWVDWALVKAEGWHLDKGKQKSKWETMPGMMFMYRAAMFFARLHCPERLMGMQSVDELSDVAAVAGQQADSAPEAIEVTASEVRSSPPVGRVSIRNGKPKEKPAPAQQETHTETAESSTATAVADPPKSWSQEVLDRLANAVKAGGTAQSLHKVQKDIGDALKRKDISDEQACDMNDEIKMKLDSME